MRRVERDFDFFAENPLCKILLKNDKNGSVLALTEKVLYFNAVMMYNESKAEIQRRISY